MIEVTPDDSLPRGVSCHMTITTEDGASYSSQVDHPRGSIANPMTPEEMSGKVRLLADDVIGKSGVNAMIDMVSNIAQSRQNVGPHRI